MSARSSERGSLPQGRGSRTVCGADDGKAAQQQVPIMGEPRVARSPRCEGCAEKPVRIARGCRQVRGLVHVAAAAPVHVHFRQDYHVRIGPAEHGRDAVQVVNAVGAQSPLDVVSHKAHRARAVRGRRPDPPTVPRTRAKRSARCRSLPRRPPPARTPRPPAAMPAGARREAGHDSGLPRPPCVPPGDCVVRELAALAPPVLPRARFALRKCTAIVRGAHVSPEAYARIRFRMLSRS